ncbi:MAG: hypothetical protein II719_06195 [Clostridia bacterium]|nr:hypothetical protein [Clostridia bacterium]
MGEKKKLAGIFKSIGNFIKKAAVYVWTRWKHNLGLKVISIIFSIIVCNLMLAQSNPVRRITVSDVPVAYEGLTTLESNALTLSEESRNLSPTITVSLNVPMQDIRKVSADLITARVNLATIRSPGEQSPAIRVSSDIGTIASTTPERLPITVENRVSKTIPVEVVLSGDMPENYSISSTNVSPDVIVITGPESTVTKVFKAQVFLDVTDLTESVSGSKNYVLVDDEGNELERGHMELSTAGVILSATVRKSVSLPVNAEASMTGIDQIADGYELAGIEVFPSSVTVTGTEKNLADVAELTTAAIDIAGLSENQTFMVGLKPIAGLSYSTASVEIVVHVTPKIMTRVFEKVPVNIINVGENLEISKRISSVTVTVTGPESVVSAMNLQNLTASVNANNLVAGTHQVSVSVSVAEAYQDRIQPGDLRTDPSQFELVLVAKEEQTLSDDLEELP